MKRVLVDIGRDRTVLLGDPKQLAVLTKTHKAGPPGKDREKGVPPGQPLVDRLPWVHSAEVSLERTTNQM